jgi:hypothetical protein
MRRVISPCLFVFAIASGLAGIEVSSAHAGCYATAYVQSYDVSISPDLDCLEIRVHGDTCVGGVDLHIANRCEGFVELTQTSPQCVMNVVGGDPAPTDCPTLSVPAGESREYRLRLDDENDGGSYTSVFDIALGEETYVVTATFTYEVRENEGACSTVPMNRPISSGVSLMMGLAFVAMGRRFVRR